MLERLRRLFGRSKCESCEAYRSMIQLQRDQVAFLEGQTSKLQDALLKAMRVDRPEIKHDPVATMPPNWAQMRRKLEGKYKVKKPEDKVEDHWVERIKEMEKEAGVNAGYAQG